MGVFDVTGRRSAKRRAEGFYGWTLPRLDPRLAFTGWLDTRTAPVREETELTCDALAEFRDPQRPEEPWAAVTEFQTEPRRDDVERLIEYKIRFRRECRPLWDPRLKYQVFGLIVNLTGPHQPDALAMPIPGMDGFGTTCRVVRIALREENAPATLTRIGQKQLDPCVLPWVAGMRGGGDPATIAEWLRLAELVHDPQVRLDYAADALVFAELLGVERTWRQALEGWNVRTSWQVEEWKDEARIETHRANLLRLLEKRFKVPAPRDVAEAVWAQSDKDVLARWFDAVAEANSLDDCRRAILSAP